MIARRSNIALKSAAALVALLAASPALANPVDGTVAAGAATITTPAQGTLTIDQHTKIVIIDWKSFNIGKGETTTFNQPGSDAMAVNRIGGNDPAKILGSLAANGKVVLIDGNGILFGKGAKVNVGSLLATTADASNADILSGKANFSSASDSNARIVNKGEINAASGMVGLVAASVANNGVIRAKMGQVTLGAARVFTIDFNGDGLIAFPVDPSLIAGALDENGKPVKALVANNGKIEGQTVLLSAKTAAQLVTNVISVKGEIVARAVSEQGGHIILDGGTGGIALAGAKLDASGDKGGGAITIGSDTAASVTVDAASSLDVSAKTVGDGGSIYVNSANTEFHGTAKAKGGATSGNGGAIETSGHALNVESAVIDTSAASGATGQWSLDPTTLTINSAFAGTLQTALATTSVTLKTNVSGNPTFTGVATGGVATSGNGDIIVNSAITWSSSNTLTLNAYGNITINSAITATNGGLTLWSGTSHVDSTSIPGFPFVVQDTAGTISASAAVNVSTFTMQFGNWVQNTATLPVFTARNFTFDSSTWNFDGTSGSFLRMKGGDGSAGNSYQIGDIYGLIGVGFSANTMTKNFKLVNNIDASALADAMSIGADSINAFKGVLDGQNFTISNLTSTGAANGMAGLFGWGFSGTLENLNLANVTIGGSSASLAGAAAAQVATFSGTATSAIINVSVSGGTVTTQSSTAGGLVGDNFDGRISGSSAVGVIVTQSGGNLANFLTTAGGLVGRNNGTITQSYATGSVTAQHAVGGLVGTNSGTISQSFATGAVTLMPGSGNLGSGSLGAGGFVGVSVSSPGSTASITQSYSLGAVTLTNTNAVNVPVGSFVGANGGVITEAYGAGFVGILSGNGTLGGFSGANTAVNPNAQTKVGNLTNTFYDTLTTGLSGQTGGLTTSQLQGTLPSGFNTLASGIWATGTGLYPYLASFGVPQAVSGIAYKDTGITPDASRALGLVPVSLTVGGVSQGSVTTGANGYYYFQLRAGTIAGGATVNATTTANVITGAVNGLGATTASGSVSGLNILLTNTIAGTVYSDYGVTALGSANVKEVMLTGGAVISTGTSNATTGAYSLIAPASSGAVMLFLDNSNGKLANTIVNYTSGSITGANLYAGYLSFFNTSAVSASAALSQLSSFATPTGFAAPGLFSANDFLFIGTNPLGSLAITSTSTTGFIVDGVNGFSFSGSGSLAIKTTATDIYLPNAVSLANGTLTLDSFHDINVGANITVSGTGKAAITTNDGGTGGDYTFFQGKSLAFTGTANSGQALTINGSAYTLLYTMADVQNISSALTTKFALAKPLTGTTLTPIAPQVVFSDASAFSGTFEGLGNTISGTAISDGTSSFVGLFSTLAGSGIIRDFGLVGGSVKTTSGDFSIAVGGLVGDSHGTILKSWSTATVTGGFYAGGLVARAAGGSISSSYATGTVTGTGDVGGLVGQMSNATITNSYATGNVSGSSTAGGLIGAASSGSITNVFSTGTSSGGGLDGSGGAGFSNAYWNTTISGKSTSPDGAGVSTTALQAGPTGLNATPWVVASGVNPVLNWQGAMPLPVPPVNISGNVYSDYGLTALGGVTVREIAAAGGTGATAIASATSVAATGAYSLTAPSSNGNYLLFLDGGSVFATTVFEYKGANVTGVNLYGGYLNFFNTSAVSASATLGELGGFTRPTAFGAGDFLFNGTTASANLAISTAATVGFTTFGLDGAASVGSSNTLALNLGQALVQATSALTVGNLLLQGTAGYVIGGAVGTVAANTRSVHILGDTVALTIGKVEGVSGITATDVQITQSAVSVTIAAGSKIQVGAHQDVIIAAPAFINNEGSDAITTGTGGAWAIYTASPAGDTFGNLDSGNTAIWSTAFNPSGIPPTTNRYIFANSPTLTFTSTDATKTYGADGASALASAYTVSGFQGITGVFAADTAANVFSGAPAITSAGTAATATVAGGPYTVTAAQGTLAALNGYTFAFASTGKLTVTPAPLTWSVADATASYGTLATPGAATLTGVLTQDTGKVTGTPGVFDSGNNAVTLSAATNAGSYNETVTGLSGTAASNYALATTGNRIGTLVINPVVLAANAVTYSVANASSTYGTLATLGAATLTGVLAQDVANVSGTVGVFDSSNAAVTLAATSNAGVYAEKVTALTGSAAGNYVLSTIGSTNGVLTINPKTLTATLIGGVSKIYDGTTSISLMANNFALSGVLAGDTVTLASLPTTGSFASKNVGTGLTVTSGSGLTLTGASAGNYTVAAASGAIGEITQKALTVALSSLAVSKTYDTTLAASLTAANFTLGGVAGSDAVSVATTAGSFDTKNVGTGKTVNVAGITLTGGDAGNYYLPNAAASGAVGTITAATVTATLSGNVEKIFDNTVAATVATSNLGLSGVLGSDVVTINTGTSASYNNVNAATNKTVTVSGLSLSGSDAGNYVLASSSVAAAVGRIDPTALTVIAALLTGNVNKTYDGTNTATLTAGNYLIQGLAPGATDVRLNNPATGTYDNANAGSGKTITVTGLAIAGGNDAINYILPVTTISGAIGTITPATLTASFNGTVSKIYDGTTTASVTSANVSLTGLIGSDAVALATLSGIYDSKDAGTGKTVTVNGLTLTGTAARNYVLASNSLSGAAGVITPKTLTTTLTGSVQKTYDGTTTAAVTTTNLSVSGVISGDAASLTAPASLTFDTKDVGTGKIVTVNGLGLTGAQGGDYVLASNVSAAIGIIVPKLVTASLAGTPTKTYDGTTTTNLTSSNFTLNGAVSGDNVGIAAVTGSYNTASAGTGKTLSASGLTLSGTAAGDYILTGNSVSGAVGVISPKTLTALLTGSVAKTYDGTTAAALVAGNYSLSGIVGSDVVTLNNPAIGTYADKNAGTGKVVSVSGLMLAGTAAGNYVLAATSFAGAVGFISQAPLTVQANNASRQESQPNPDLSITLQGLVGGDTASVLTGVTLSTAAGLTSPVGVYTVTSAGGSATNYVVTKRLDGTLTVTPRPANADVPGLNNALPASNSNYNGSLPSFGTTAPAPGSSAGVTGAGGSLICDVSNSDANTQTCRSGGSQAANGVPGKSASRFVHKLHAAMLKVRRRVA